MSNVDLSNAKPGSKWRTRGGWMAEKTENDFLHHCACQRRSCGEGHWDHYDDGKMMSERDSDTTMMGCGCDTVANHDIVAPWPSAEDIPDTHEDTGDFRKPEWGEDYLGMDKDGWPAYKDSGTFGPCMEPDPVWAGAGGKRHILRKKAEAPKAEDAEWVPNLGDAVRAKIDPYPYLMGLDGIVVEIAPDRSRVYVKFNGRDYSFDPAQLEPAREDPGPVVDHPKHQRDPENPSSIVRAEATKPAPLWYCECGWRGRLSGEPESVLCPTCRRTVSLIAPDPVWHCDCGWNGTDTPWRPPTEEQSAARVCQACGKSVGLIAPPPPPEPAKWPEVKYSHMSAEDRPSGLEERAGLSRAFRDRVTPADDKCPCCGGRGRVRMSQAERSALYALNRERGLDVDCREASRPCPECGEDK